MSECTLEFEAGSHTYRLDGRPIPSVTTILSFGADLSRIPQWTSDRGTALHLATEYDDEGDLDEDSVDPLVRPHLEAYRRWKIKAQPQYVVTEYRVWGEHEGLVFGGTIDRVAYLSGELVVIDLKSGQRRPEHGAQLAAYARAWTQRDGREPDRTMALYLGQDATSREVFFRDECWDYFVEKLRAYYAAQEEVV